jgi:hypothetical protein
MSWIAELSRSHCALYDAVVADDWTREEVEAAVASYFAMLEQELRGVPYNKSEVRRRLSTILNRRTPGAIERKHQNISAILIELGFPYIGGYKPLSNYQLLLLEVVANRLHASPVLLEVARERVERPLPDDRPAEDVLARLVPAPAPLEPQRRDVIADRRRPRVITNFLEVEARNRSLGRQGEEFTIRFETERLWRAGKKHLADRIEHIAGVLSDAEGYDVRSFEENGRERYIEVKTTAFGIHTPFFVSRNEVEVSAERADQYYVYRLFDFRHDPRLFVVRGQISAGFALEATQFKARPR